MVHKKTCQLPFEIEHKAYWAPKEVNWNVITAKEETAFHLNELDKIRLQAYENSRIYKERNEHWHDTRLKEFNVFNEGDKVLLYQTRFKFSPGKLKSK